MAVSRCWHPPGMTRGSRCCEPFWRLTRPVRGSTSFSRPRTTRSGSRPMPAWLGYAPGNRRPRQPATELVPLGMTAAALSLPEDRNHNLWIGTATGATRVLMTGFSLFSTADGIPAASSLIETPASMVPAMTAGTTRAGASWFDGRRFVPLQLPIYPADTSWGWNQLLLAGRDGEWWIGARSGALRLRGVNDLTRLQHAPIQRFSTRDGLTANVVLRLFEDSHGDVWIGTVGEGKANGLSRWERSTGSCTITGPTGACRTWNAFRDRVRGGSRRRSLDRLQRRRRPRPSRGGTIERVVAQDAPAMGAVRNLLVSSPEHSGRRCRAPASGASTTPRSIPVRLDDDSR